VEPSRAAGVQLPPPTRGDTTDLVNDFPAFKRSAVRYWERRRLIYNVALVLPAWLGYEFTDMMNWVGDRHERYYGFTISLLVVSAIGANICYTFAYALEFLRGSDDPSSNWLRQERTLCFVFGVLFAMLLALIGGRNIALAEWSYGASQRRLSSQLHTSPGSPSIRAAVVRGSQTEFQVI
jgi:hypothetical protein